MTLHHHFIRTGSHPGYGKWYDLADFPAPNPDNVVIEEEFDHYVLYIDNESFSCHDLDEALRTLEMYNRSSYSTKHYPLEASWDIALKALDELVAEAMRIDQDWSRWPTVQIDYCVKTLRQVHTYWQEDAENDGRTW